MPLIPISNIAKSVDITDEPKFGTVVDNNDPERLGRIKVTIPGIFEGVTSELPWVRRKQDTSFCGLDCEIFDVPEIGSIVEIKWNYDENTPMYSGAPYNKKQTSKIFTNNYPYEGGIKFGKMFIKFDKASNNMTISNGKTFIQLDTLGNVKIIADANIDFYSKGDFNIHAINTNISGNLTVNGDFYCNQGANGSINLLVNASVSGGLVRTIE